MCRQTGKQTNKQTNRQTNKQTDRQTNKQTGKQTNRQTLTLDAGDPFGLPRRSEPDAVLSEGPPP